MTTNYNSLKYRNSGTDIVTSNFAHGFHHNFTIRFKVKEKPDDTVYADHAATYNAGSGAICNKCLVCFGLGLNLGPPIPEGIGQALYIRPPCKIDSL